MIRFSGIENITPRIRVFMREFPNKAAEAIRAAAEMTVIERAKQIFEQGPPTPHNWKGELSASIRARTTRKAASGRDLAYAAVIIEYGPSKSTESSKQYWKRFEAGGIHKDWPWKRMEKWVREKLKLPEDMVKGVTGKIIKKLNKEGALEYPVLQDAWNDSEQEFIVEWRANLREKFSPTSGGGKNVPF